MGFSILILAQSFIKSSQPNYGFYFNPLPILVGSDQEQGIFMLGPCSWFYADIKSDLITDLISNIGTANLWYIYGTKSKSNLISDLITATNYMDQALHSEKHQVRNSHL